MAVARTAKQRAASRANLEKARKAKRTYPKSDTAGGSGYGRAIRKTFDTGSHTAQLAALKQMGLKPTESNLAFVKSKNRITARKTITVARKDRQAERVATGGKAQFGRRSRSKTNPVENMKSKLDKNRMRAARIRKVAKSRKKK